MTCTCKDHMGCKATNPHISRIKQILSPNIYFPIPLDKMTVQQIRQHIQKTEYIQAVARKPNDDRNLRPIRYYYPSGIDDNFPSNKRYMQALNRQYFKLGPDYNPRSRKPCS